MPESEPTARVTDTPVNRAPEGEGFRASRPMEKGEPIQQSVYDGAGNEVVVVTADQGGGARKQGTGANAAEAMEDAMDPSEPIGEGFGTASGH